MAVAGANLKTPSTRIFSKLQLFLWGFCVCAHVSSESDMRICNFLSPQRFVGVFNRTIIIIPLVLVGYEMIII